MIILTTQRRTRLLSTPTKSTIPIINSFTVPPSYLDKLTMEKHELNRIFQSKRQKFTFDHDHLIYLHCSVVEGDQVIQKESMLDETDVIYTPVKSNLHSFTIQLVSNEQVQTEKQVEKKEFINDQDMFPPLSPHLLNIHDLTMMRQKFIIFMQITTGFRMFLGAKHTIHNTSSHQYPIDIVKMLSDDIFVCNQRRTDLVDNVTQKWLATHIETVMTLMENEFHCRLKPNLIMKTNTNI